MWAYSKAVASSIDVRRFQGPLHCIDNLQGNHYSIGAINQLDKEGMTVPARAERLYLYPDLHVDRPAETGQILDFPVWWDRRAFFNQFGERSVDCSNPMDDKSAYLLFVDEAVAFDKECLAERLNVGTVGQHIYDRQAELIAALRRSKWVIVESYEWG